MFSSWKNKSRLVPSAPALKPQRTSTQVGAAAEDQALAYLQSQGLELLQRNYRVAGGPGRRAAEIDLILRDPDGTFVFVEVRSRASSSWAGGAAASIGTVKQVRLRRAAEHYLLRFQQLPPCRFDVVCIEDGVLQWLPGAFEV